MAVTQRLIEAGRVEIQFWFTARRDACLGRGLKGSRESDTRRQRRTQDPGIWAPAGVMSVGQSVWRACKSVGGPAGIAGSRRNARSVVLIAAIS